ncbi:hypothetical protein [Ulvibacterium marinum]|uniref:hypothetical protein n=1 Tax=Ulvibacterium marinum TaxID=2419782 RepID=UPI00249521A3|nr:hypothetical protein [Ulvibacterium marinum]
MKKNYTLAAALLFSILSFAQTTKQYKWSTASTSGEVTFNNLNDIGSIDLEDIGGFTSINFDGITFNTGSTPPMSNFFNGQKVNVGKLVTELKKPGQKGSIFNPKGKTITIIDNAAPTVTKNITIKIGSGEGPQNKLTEFEQQELIAKEFSDGVFDDNIYTKDWAQKFYDSRNNLVLNGKTVHVFLDEFGNTLFSGFPTTAREDYNYSFHIFYTTQSNASSIKVEVRGVYEPTFEVYNSEALSSIGLPSASSDIGANNIPKAKVKVINIEKKGPFTSSFTFRMKKTVNGEEQNVIPKRVINVAPVHHISLMVGLVGSYLSNPTNIAEGLNSDGESTLFADDPETRGMITLMAVFYPMPRNLLFPPKKTFSFERLGIVVGTRIDADLDENFLGGVSYDLARGLSITAGVHYGRVNAIGGYDDFNFGEDTFSGELITTKKWQAHLFIGTTIDLRVFGLLFNPQGQTR